MTPGVGAFALRPRRVASALLGLLAAAFAAGSWRLGFWTDDGPGAGMLPFAAAVLLLPLLVVTFREPAAEEETPFTARGLAAVALLLTYALVAPRIGFVIPTVVFVVLWAKVFHAASLVRALVLAACLTGAGVVVFGILLKVPMPLLPVRG